MPRRHAACGTPSGYRRHLRDGETACLRCLDAEAVDSANRRAARRQRQGGPIHPIAYRAALAGREPAEALVQADRHRLVAELHARGWTDVQIATHTRMTTYTTARIRTHLGLPAVSRPVTRRGAA